MKAEVSYSSKIISFRFFPNKDDVNLLSQSIHLHARSCYFEMPADVNPDNIHPDLIALSTLLLVYPFTHNKLELDTPVSKEFVEICAKNFGLMIKAPIAEISPRAIKDGVPALAFSGGVDSNAALALLPNDKIVYFIDRIIPYGKKSLYNKFATKVAFDDIKEAIPNSYSIATDMEYLRSKIGFPLDSANSDVPLPVTIPALLMADLFNIDAVAFGVVMESLYMVGHETYEDYSSCEHYKKWAPLFSHVNCNLFFPTGGMTEVGTTIISDKSQTSNYIRSCMRGDEHNSCGKCIKCLRKSLLRKAVKREAANLNDIVANLDSVQVVANLYGVIYQHENIYRYICQCLPSNHVIDLLKKRVQIESEDCAWMERWFPDSIDLIPYKYRQGIIQKIFEYIDPMHPIDISYVKAWDVNKVRHADPSHLELWQKFLYVNASIHVRRYIDQAINRRDPG